MTLREVIEVDTQLRWLQGSPEGPTSVKVKELIESEVKEWTDGSRSDEGAAGATQSRGCTWVR